MPDPSLYAGMLDAAEKKRSSAARDKRRRRGKFRIPLPFVDGEGVMSWSFDLATAVFSGVLVVDARVNIADRTITYWAYSEHFGRLGEAEAAPEYVAEIHVDDNGPQPAYRVAWKSVGHDHDPWAGTQDDFGPWYWAPRPQPLENP